MRILLVLCLFCSAFHDAVWAGPTDTSTTPLRTYTVGVERLNYEPFFFNNERGYQGFARDVLDLFQQQYRIRLNYVALPVVELKEQFYNGKLDFKFPDDRDWQPAQYRHIKVLYSKPVVSYVDGVCVKLVMDDRPVQKIAVPSGFHYGLLQDRVSQAHFQIVEMDSIETILRALIDGEVDGAWGSMDVFRYKAKRFGNVTFSVNLELPHKVGAYSMSTIEHADVLSLFDRFLVNNQDKILEIESKWRIDALRQLRLQQLRREREKKQ